MFQYIYPQFEQKRLLRIEMLEQLRDYPKYYLGLLYQNFGDGIVSGCEIIWDKGKLTLSPGMVYRNGNLYFMEKPHSIECGAEDNLRYFKVQFLAEAKEAGKIIGNTRILLDDRMPDPACEIELCRFRLQEGARLRDSHENFEDYATEYDTINLIHAPYASTGKRSTLNPVILREFAKETVKNGTIDPYDVSFTMNILANDGVLPAECILGYLDARLEGMKKEPDNQELYRGLSKVLREQFRGVQRNERDRQGRKGVLLM